jgi:hypothetical protein
MLIQITVDIMLQLHLRKDKRCDWLYWSSVVFLLAGCNHASDVTRRHLEKGKAFKLTLSVNSPARLELLAFCIDSQRATIVQSVNGVERVEKTISSMQLDELVESLLASKMIELPVNFGRDVPDSGWTKLTLDAAGNRFSSTVRFLEIDSLPEKNREQLVLLKKVTGMVRSLAL